MKTTKWYSLILFLFLIFNIKAQHFEMGYESGLGIVGIYHPHSENKALSCFENIDLSSFRTGFSTHFYPGSSIISIKSGLIYSRLDSRYISSMKLIQLPIGADVLLGRKKHFEIGGGVYFNYLLRKKIYDAILQDYQMGVYANIGVHYPVDEKVSIGLKAHYGYDLTKLYTDISYSPYAGDIFSDIYTTHLFLVISIRCKLFAAANTK